MMRARNRDAIYMLVLGLALGVFVALLVSQCGFLRAD
jgi:hypothetical protein